VESIIWIFSCFPFHILVLRIVPGTWKPCLFTWSSMVILAHCWHIGFLAHIKQQGYPLSFWRMKRWRPDESQCDNHKLHLFQHKFMYHIVACLEKLKKKHENPVRHLHDSWRETPKNSCHIHIQDADLRSLLQASEHTQAARTYQKWDPWHWTDLGNDPFRDTVESEMILWISELIWRTLHFLSPSHRHIVAAVLQRWAGKTSKKLHS